MSTAEQILEAPRPSPGRNPWPCSRCASPVQSGVNAGRLPFGALVALACLTLLLLAGLGRWEATPVRDWLLALAALALLVRLSNARRARRAWHCPQCGHHERARLHHAGPLHSVVIVPTYNNATTIADVLQRIAGTAPELPVFVVDDGSTDDTDKLARQALQARPAAAAPWDLLRHPTNQGKGAALATGLHTAFERGYSHAITLDADGQHWPEDLPAMQQAAAAHPTAILVGARDLSGNTVESSSRFGRAFSNFWLRVQTGVRVEDSQSGYRVYPVAATLALGTRSSAYDFEVEVLTLGARAGVPLRCIPIRVHYPPPSERVSHFDKLWDNVRISWVNTRLLAGFPLWPLGWPARLSRRSPPQAPSRSWSGRSRGGALGHTVFLWLLRHGARLPAYWLLYAVAFYFMFTARPTVHASRAFLDRAVGTARNPWARFWRSYRHIHTFAEVLLERALANVLGAKPFGWSSEGMDHVRAAISPGSRGAIFLSAHLGNYELGGALFSQGDIPFNVVMLDAEAEAIKRVYERYGGEEFPLKIIPVNRTELPSLRILSALRSGEIVALHGDRIMDEHWVWCDFFDQRAAFPTGVFTLAAVAKVPVILTFGFKTGRSRYHFLAEPPRMIELPRHDREEALARHAQWYAARLEAYARLWPYQWFNFYDFWQKPSV